MDKQKLTKVGAVAAIAIGILYLLNPTAGIFELLPDVMPIVGNLDEAGATVLVVWGIQALREQPAAQADNLIDQP